MHQRVTNVAVGIARRFVRVGRALRGPHPARELRKPGQHPHSLRPFSGDALHFPAGEVEANRELRCQPIAVRHDDQDVVLRSCGDRVTATRQLRPTSGRGCRWVRHTARAVACESAPARSRRAASRHPTVRPAGDRDVATARPVRAACARTAPRPVHCERRRASARARSRAPCTAAAGSDPERRTRSVALRKSARPRAGSVNGILSAERDLAARRRLERTEHVEQRALAAARWTGDRRRLAWRRARTSRPTARRADRAVSDTLCRRSRRSASRAL